MIGSNLPRILLVAWVLLHSFRCGWSTPETISFRVKFAGNHALSDGKLREKANRPEFERYSMYLVDDLVDVVEDAYRADGYADVKVKGSDLPDGEKRVIRLEIEEGPRFTVSSVEIEGNKTFDTKDLLAFLRQRPGFRAKPYNRAIATDDRRTLEDYYRGHGFLRVRVDGEDILDREKGETKIRHKITEGNRYYLTGIDFLGNTVFSNEELATASRIAVGKPYDPTLVNAARARLLDLYRDHGYAYVKIEPKVEVSDDEGEVRLSFDIKEGAQVRLGEIRLEGLTRSRPRLVWREVDLSKGEVYSRGALFENRRRIFSTGLFSSVELEPSPPLTGQATTDVTIRVEEAKAGRLRAGVGYGTEEGPRASLEAGYANLFGVGHEIGLTSSITGIGNEEEVYHRVRHVFGSQYNFRDRIYHRFLEEPSFSVERLGANFEVERKIENVWFLRLGYTIEDLSLSDVKISPTLEDLRESEGILSKAGFSVTRDHRDNSLNPHSGSLGWLDLELGGSFLGGDFTFAKARTGYTRFLPVTKRTTLVPSFRAGAIEPFGGSDFSPLSERFLTGGETTIRGFRRDEVGPTDASGEFIGGDALLLFNLEYRFPVYKRLNGAVFIDAGNVWPSVSDVDLSDMRKSAGVGLRYMSPVGAIRVDYGHILDPKRDEPTGRIHFSIGYAF